MTEDAQTQDFEVLDGLISLSIGSAEALRTAGGHAKHTSLGPLLLERASDRDHLVHELQAGQRALRGDGGDTGRESVAGMAHRAILDVCALIGGNVQSAIAEIERSEDSLRQHFEQATYRKDISPSVRALIARCCSRLREDHDEVWALQHATN